MTWCLHKEQFNAIQPQPQRANDTFPLCADCDATEWKCFTLIKTHLMWTRSMRVDEWWLGMGDIMFLLNKTSLKRLRRSDGFSTYYRGKDEMLRAKGELITRWVLVLAWHDPLYSVYWEHPPVVSLRKYLITLGRFGGGRKFPQIDIFHLLHRLVLPTLKSIYI